MNILTISGSTRAESSNVKLLEALPSLFPEKKFSRYSDIQSLPLFNPEEDQHPWAAAVLHWREALKASDAVIICIPEYIHNLPAVVKNALEWIVSSGELFGKPVLAMTFTPHAPRGEKAMQSLIWSLQALDARVVGQLAMYQNEVKLDDQTMVAEAEILEMLREAIALF